MSERVCGDRVLCLTGKKKKRRIKGSGSLTRVGRETSLRESFRYSKRRVGVIFPSPSQGPLSQARSSSDLHSCAGLCGRSRMRSREGHCADCFLCHLGKVIPLASTLTKTGQYFSMCFWDRSTVGYS